MPENSTGKKMTGAFLKVAAEATAVCQEKTKC